MQTQKKIEEACSMQSTSRTNPMFGWRENSSLFGAPDHEGILDLIPSYELKTEGQANQSLTRVNVTKTASTHIPSLYYNVKPKLF
jgi:hypothetical protein